MLLPRESAPSIITPEIWRFVDSQDWPVGMDWNLSTKDGVIWLLLYRDNFVSFDGEDLQQIANVTNRIFMKLRANGVPIFLKVLPTKPVIDNA